MLFVNMLVLFSGSIKLFSYSIEGNKLRKTLSIHKKDARTIEFDAEGRRLFSGSLDKSVKITDMVRKSRQAVWVGRWLGG